MTKIEIEQGTPEWISIRKSRITATDASIIMGFNPWKTSDQLLKEKLDTEFREEENEVMRRGSELEPIARKRFIDKSGIFISPTVHLYDDWAMCSTDGLSNDGKTLVEIKCGRSACNQANKGRIPAYYHCQMQHQLWITDLDKCYYMAFNGEIEIVMVVKRNDYFIEKMIEKEYKFYQEMQERRSYGPIFTISSYNHVLRSDDVGNDEVFAERYS